MKRNALVFDIETIADLTPENRAAVAALAAGREQTAEHFGALCPPLARVVCIVCFDLAAARLTAFFDAGWCTGERPATLRVPAGNGAPALECELHACEGEAGVLREFGRFAEAHMRQPEAQLVTYNGRGFDLPVLVHRSVKHAVTDGRALIAKAARENRYNPVLHLDLMDAVTFAGASPRWPLAAYALGYGWRSPKAEMDGSQVHDAVHNGRVLDVVGYCAGDVLATAHVHRCLHGLPPAERAPR